MPRKQDSDDSIRKNALVLAREHIDEALAILEGPLEDAKADRIRSRLESLVAILRDARTLTLHGGR